MVERINKKNNKTKHTGNRVLLIIIIGRTPAGIIAYYGISIIYLILVMPSYLVYPYFFMNTKYMWLLFSSFTS